MIFQPSIHHEVISSNKIDLNILEEYKKINLVSGSIANMIRYVELNITFYFTKHQDMIYSRGTFLNIEFSESTPLVIL